METTIVHWVYIGVMGLGLNDHDYDYEEHNCYCYSTFTPTATTAAGAVLLPKPSTLNPKGWRGRPGDEACYAVWACTWGYMGNIGTYGDVWGYIGIRRDARGLERDLWGLQGHIGMHGGVHGDLWKYRYHQQGFIHDKTQVLGTQGLRV